MTIFIDTHNILMAILLITNLFIEGMFAVALASGERDKATTGGCVFLLIVGLANIVLAFKSFH